MLKGKAKDDDLGFVETQAGLVDGQGRIFLQQKRQHWGIYAALCIKLGQTENYYKNE